MGTIVLSALVGAHGVALDGRSLGAARKFTFEWPAIDAAFLAGAMRWMMLLVVAAALYWLCFGVLGPNLKSEEL